MVRRESEFYSEIDGLAFLSKNMYNMTLYNIRQHYFETGKVLPFKENYHLIKKVQKNDYNSLPHKVSNQVLKHVYGDMNSFFRARKAFIINPSKFTGEPKLTKYKDPSDGRNMLKYERGTVSKKDLKKGFIKLSMTDIRIPTKVTWENLKEVRIVQTTDGYAIEVVYEVKGVPLKKDEQGTVPKYGAGDLGVNNLMTMVFSDGTQPLIICGGPIKSINQYYNKKLAELKSELVIRHKKKTSRKIKKLTQKRNNKINDYLHKMSRTIVNHLVDSGITDFYIGKNDGWKQDTNLGKKNNQNFVSIPFNKFIDMINYKSLLAGIYADTIGEAYTSKCSFLDGETVGKHETYKGKRVKRGLFQTSTGRLINADVNAAYNIMTKAIPNVFDQGIEGVAVNPVIVKHHKVIS